MGYRDDFYIGENIIGYTGDRQNKPSVYFFHGGEFGRITQNYPEADNIGRNKVRRYFDYKIYNSKYDGCAIEYYAGEVQHESRSPFVAIGNQDIIRWVLAISTVAHKELKPAHQ